MISEAEAKLLSIIAVTSDCTRGKLVKVQQTLDARANPWHVAAQVGWLIKFGLVTQGPELTLTEKGKSTLGIFKEKWGSPADRLRRKVVG